MKKHSNKMAALAMLISASIAAPAAIAQMGSGAASPCAPKRQRSASPCGPANPCAPKRRSKRAEEVLAEKEAAEKAEAEKAEAEKKEHEKKEHAKKEAGKK
jgi:hypothetical protein